MALAVSNLVNFNESITNKAFYITDTSNYVANGISLANVKGIFKLTSPLGVEIYKNVGWDTSSFASPDIDGSVSLQFNTQLLPLDADGNVLKGQYTIEYKSQVSGGVLPGTYTMTPIIYNYQFIPAEISITQSFSCANQTFTSNDSTVYGNYLSLSRTHTLYYPQGILPSSPPDVVTSAGIITIADLYTQTYTTSVLSIVTYQLGAFVTGSYSLYGTREEPVYCSYDPCKIYCCIKSAKTKMDAFKGKNDVLFEEAAEVYNSLMDLKTTYDLAVSCGDTDQATAVMDEMVRIGNCGACDSCGQQSDTPTRVNNGINIPSSASQDEVDLGVITNKYVSPGTLSKRGIFPYSALIAYLSGRWVVYSNVLYNIVTNTIAGETPLTAPAKFQVINIPAATLAELKIGSATDKYLNSVILAPLVIFTLDTAVSTPSGRRVEFEGQLFSTLSTINIGEDPNTARTKFHYLGGGINISNVAAGSTTIALNKTSGVITATTTIVAGAVATITINNTCITDNTDVSFEIENDGTGLCSIANKKLSANQAVLVIKNQDAVTSITSFKIFMNVRS